MLHVGRPRLELRSQNDKAVSYQRTDEWPLSTLARPGQIECVDVRRERSKGVASFDLFCAAAILRFGMLGMRMERAIYKRVKMWGKQKQAVEDEEAHLAQRITPGSCRWRCSSGRAPGTPCRSSSRFASSHPQAARRHTQCVGQIRPRQASTNMREGNAKRGKRYLERELELLIELGHELVVREGLPGLHDAHDGSVNLELSVLEHALLRLGVLLLLFSGADERLTVSVTGVSWWF